MSLPVPKSLSELVQTLHLELGSEGLDSASIDASRIQQIISSYEAQPEDYERFALFDGSKYTRNLVDNGNGKFNLMILCWAPGQSSPIHDHSNAHCILKILEGEIEETQYYWPEGLSPTGESSPYKEKPEMAIKRSGIYTANQTSYMHDKLGLHRVGNPSSQKGAITLHLYTPPYETCRTFEEASGNCRPSGKCLFYSENGQKCNHAAGCSSPSSSSTPHT